MFNKWKTPKDGGENVPKGYLKRVSSTTHQCGARLGILNGLFGSGIWTFGYPRVGYHNFRVPPRITRIHNRVTRGSGYSGYSGHNHFISAPPANS